MRIRSAWAKLTPKERDAIIDALGFVTAGLDPWEDKDDEQSDTYKACWTAWSKLTGRAYRDEGKT